MEEAAERYLATELLGNVMIPDLLYEDPNEKQYRLWYDLQNVSTLAQMLCRLYIFCFLKFQPEDLAKLWDVGE